MQLLLQVTDKHLVCIFIEGDDAGSEQAVDNDSIVQDFTVIIIFTWLGLSQPLKTFQQFRFRAWQMELGKI